MASKFLVSTTEKDLPDALGNDCMVSPIPETRGADVLIYSEAGLMGLQRKAVPNDFLGSFTDGRLARALALMKEKCAFQRVIGEGKFNYYPDRTVDLGRYKGGKRILTRFTESRVLSIINDIELVHGVQVDWTKDIEQTVLYLRCMRKFLDDKTHIGLFRRPKAQGLWNVPTGKDIELWVLQSFPGIGPSSADKIIKFFGGVVPMRWACTVDELSMVPGISKSKAEELWKYLPEGEIKVDLTQAKSKKAVEDHFAQATHSLEFDALRSRLRLNRGG